MKNVLNWIVKILLCWGLGYLAFRYLNLFSHWLDEKVGFPFLSFLVTLAFVGFACFVAWIDRKIGFSKCRPSIVRGVICALAGIPTVAVAAVDFWKMTYFSGWTGIFYLLFIHVFFAAMLFILGYSPDKLM